MKSLAFFFRNRIKNPFRRIVYHYVSFKLRYLRKNGINSYTYQDEDFVIHYHMGGKGPVLLFIHGFAMDALMNWADQLPLFRDTSRLSPLICSGSVKVIRPKNLYYPPNVKQSNDC